MADAAPSTAQATRGVVYTFYSFKGGVGRSMALANAASLLAKWGKRVLVLDWDLEAPGIEKFFQRWISGSRKNTPGLVDIITDFSNGSPRDWHGCLLKAKLPDHPKEVHIISAGQDGPGNSAADYGRNLQQIKWDQLFDEKRRFGGYLERLRREWTAEYDFVLVDSRTGITDIGGICTIHLPDVLVCLFTTTEQSLQGVKDVMERAATLHASLPVDRKKLMIVPLPARDESRTEYKLAKEWRARFATELAPFYKDWAPKDEKIEEILDLLKIPYVAFWSFGEKLPVLEEDVNNPDKLAYFYQAIARLMHGRLDLREVRQGTQTTEAAETQKAEAAKATEAAAALRLKAQQEAANAERVKREEERIARAALYKEYAQGRVKSMTGVYLRMASIFLGIAIVLGVAFFGGAVILAPDISGNDRIRSIFTWVVLGVAAVSATLIYVSRQYRRKANDLRTQQAFFEGSVGAYEGADAVQAFVKDAEAIIARSVLQPVQRAAVPATPSAPERLEDRSTRVFSPAALERDVAEPRAVLREKDATRTARAVAPSASPSSASQYDVYISARRDPFIKSWLSEFIPLFRSWVSDLAGREVSIVVGEEIQAARETVVVGAADFDRFACLVAVVTPAHFQSQWNRDEWDAFAASRPDAIVPILLRGSFDMLPQDVRRVQYFDFTEYAFVGEGFQKTQAYVDFQSQIRRLAERVADVLTTRQPSNAVTLKQV